MGCERLAFGVVDYCLGRDFGDELVTLTVEESLRLTGDDVIGDNGGFAGGGKNPRNRFGRFGVVVCLNFS